MLKKTNLCCFSPTGGTRHMGELFCQDISEEMTVTDLLKREENPQQPDSDLTVIAAPVFGGRIPSTAADRIKALKGQGKKAVTLAVYGVRAYEDALLELNNAAKAQGFEIIASAALVTRHSIVPEVGADRPDEKDLEQLRAFAKEVEDKLSAADRKEDRNGQRRSISKKNICRPMNMRKMWREISWGWSRTMRLSLKSRNRLFFV